VGEKGVSQEIRAREMGGSLFPAERGSDQEDHEGEGEVCVSQKSQGMSGVESAHSKESNWFGP
jgi:hypothetical protein